MSLNKHGVGNVVLTSGRCYKHSNTDSCHEFEYRLGAMVCNGVKTPNMVAFSLVRRQSFRFFTHSEFKL